MKYDVIPANTTIKAGEIRVEAESLERVSVCRYSKDRDPNSGCVIDTLDLFDYIMQDKYEFLQDVKNSILRAHMKPQNVRITKEVMDFFAHEND